MFVTNTLFFLNNPHNLFTFIFRVWADYEQGFGNFVLRNGEYWLGNKNLHYLTSQGKTRIKIIFFSCLCPPDRSTVCFLFVCSLFCYFALFSASKSGIFTLVLNPVFEWSF